MYSYNVIHVLRGIKIPSAIQRKYSNTRLCGFQMPRDAMPINPMQDHPESPHDIGLHVIANESANFAVETVT